MYGSEEQAEEELSVRKLGDCLGEFRFYFEKKRDLTLRFIVVVS